MPLTVIPEFTPRVLSRYGCFICGIDHNRDRLQSALGRDRVITTGVDIDFEGRLDICESCVEEAASLIGMVKADKYETAEDEIGSLTCVLVERTAQLEALRAQNDALREALAGPALQTVPVPPARKPAASKK